MNQPDFGDILGKVRSMNPVVHHITNYVTANDCANVTLAVGAIPIMADYKFEASFVTSRSDALVLNMGTPSKERIQAMILSGIVAKGLEIPVVFDPVGVGASSFRKRSADEILKDIKCSVIRCNASEMLHLLERPNPKIKIDVSSYYNDLGQIIEAASRMSTRYDCVVAVTGETDVISYKDHSALIHNGHQSLRLVTGTGCMCDSLVASFCSNGTSAFDAAVCGVACMGIAGEIAFDRAGHIGTGSLRVAIIDAISAMTPDIMAERIKMEEA
ncbi:MAG: hydroxyethylthiazole kinase [Synergistaceae bacterium]|jgi:hydroxyethylthiazole kinase|nr:hydroxyethylthiazole kinase [Synergistaceae bacterium]